MTDKAEYIEQLKKYIKALENEISCFNTLDVTQQQLIKQLEKEIAILKQLIREFLSVICESDLITSQLAKAGVTKLNLYYWNSPDMKIQIRPVKDWDVKNDNLCIKNKISDDLHSEFFVTLETLKFGNILFEPPYSVDDTNLALNMDDGSRMDILEELFKFELIELKHVTWEITGRKSLVNNKPHNFGTIFGPGVEP